MLYIDFTSFFWIWIIIHDEFLRWMLLELDSTQFSTKNGFLGFSRAQEEKFEVAFGCLETFNTLHTPFRVVTQRYLWRCQNRESESIWNLKEN